MGQRVIHRGRLDERDPWAGHDGIELARGEMEAVDRLVLPVVLRNLDG